MAERDEILQILDEGALGFVFPMLDNGYVYLAAGRLSLHRSDTDWAMVFEIFGFAPRAGIPDIWVTTFGSRLAAGRHDQRSQNPIDRGSWQDPENPELVVDGEAEVLVRGRAIPIPPPQAYAGHGIELESPPRVQTFELCRYLADVAHDDVLATPAERRAALAPDVVELLVLDEWTHPNVIIDERPSGSETFRQLADVLATGDVGLYQPTTPPNNHWRNWPEGGRL
jgi:hypothetical protein